MQGRPTRAALPCAEPGRSAKQKHLHAESGAGSDAPTLGSRCVRMGESAKPPEACARDYQRRGRRFVASNREPGTGQPKIATSMVGVGSGRSRLLQGGLGVANEQGGSAGASGHSLAFSDGALLPIHRAVGYTPGRCRSVNVAD